MGAFPIFRVAGIQVYLHFSWLLVAWFEIGWAARRYQSPAYGVFEYLALFLMVLLHEFGHAFACRSTGGKAERIVLWPLGGLALTDPPPRPAAVLWTIAAGPLVNVALVPVLMFFAYATGSDGWINADRDLRVFAWVLNAINLSLLIFNVLPFYPLDGGQIVRALLWFKIGPIRSLRVAAIMGMVGAVLVGLLALSRQSIWLGVIAFFLFSQAAGAIARAKAMQRAVDASPSSSDPGPPPIPPGRS
jgi:Zn-dependent protease